MKRSKVGEQRQHLRDAAWGETPPAKPSPSALSDGGEKWTHAELYAGLEAIVKLQAHYADLLNMHDGGERIPFKSADEWLIRRREIFTGAKAWGETDAG